MLRRFPRLVALALAQAACFTPVVQVGGADAGLDAGADGGVGDGGAGDGGAFDGGGLDAGGAPFDAGWEDVEQTCDGYDNDGDGRVDISRPVFLGATEQSYWQWEFDGTRLVSVWGEDGVRYGIHTRDLATRNEFLADPTLFTWARLSPLNDRVALSWQRRTKDGGSTEVFAAIVGPDGGLGLLASLAVGPQPSPSGVHPLFIAEPRDRGCIVLLWQNLCAGWQRMGLSLAQDGGTLVGPIGLISSPIVPGCGNYYYPFHMIPLGQSRLTWAGGEFHLDAGVATQVFYPVDCSLDAGPPSWGFPAPSAWQSPSALGSHFLRSLGAPGGTRAGEHAVLRVGVGWSQLWHQLADGGGPLTPVVPTWTSIIDGTTEPFVVWPEGTSPTPALPTKFFAQGMSQRLDLTVPGMNPLAWAVSIGGGLSAVAFVLDGGTYPDGGARFLRYGQLFCDPH